MCFGMRRFETFVIFVGLGVFIRVIGSSVQRKKRYCWDDKGKCSWKPRRLSDNIAKSSQFVECYFLLHIAASSVYMLLKLFLRHFFLASPFPALQPTLISKTSRDAILPHKSIVYK